MKVLFLIILMAPEIILAAGKPFNPDTSVNFLGVDRISDQHTGEAINRNNSDESNGFKFQEAEIQFTSDVDVYFKANAIFSVHPSDNNANRYELSPEEVYLTSSALPGIAMKLGKFQAALGKQNATHTHAFSFIDAPMINRDLLGDGLNEVGISMAYLAPLPWFFEITGQLLSSSNETLYNSENSNDKAYLLQLKNLWEINDSLTMEWSLYGSTGKNSLQKRSGIFGSDLIFKWRPPVGGKYTAFIFGTEFLEGDHFNYNQLPNAKIGSLVNYIQYQIGERWWVQARNEFEGFNKSRELPNKRRESLLLAFLPSEFSAFRLQYDFTNSDKRPKENALTLQWNITIGAHPAHNY